MSSSAVAGLSGPPSASPLILPPSAGLHNAAQGISGDRSVTVAIGRIIRTCRNGKRDGSDIGNRGKQTWAVTSRWPPRPAARCPADPASGTPIPGRDAWQSVSAIPSRHTATRAGRCGVALQLALVVGAIDSLQPVFRNLQRPRGQDRLVLRSSTTTPPETRPASLFRATTKLARSALRSTYRATAKKCSSSSTGNDL